MPIESSFRSAATRSTLGLLMAAASMLAGCDQLGIESPEKLAAARLAEGNAIGSACRHAGRAIEDCYALNKRADKAAVFAGWRDMNDYMRENKIEPVPPQLNAQGVSLKAVDAEAADAEPAPTKSTKETKETKETKAP